MTASEPPTDSTQTARMDAMDAAIGREVVVLEIVSDDDEPGQGPASDDSVMEAWNQEDDRQRHQLIQQEMQEAIAELESGSSAGRSTFPEVRNRFDAW